MIIRLTNNAKKNNMSDYTPFKMNGNPFSTGGVAGTNSHASALKKRSEEDKKRSFIKKDKEEIGTLLERRKELKAKRDKLEKPGEGEKKIFLGNIRRKRNEKKIEKNQKSINSNKTAQMWKKKKNQQLDNEATDKLEKSRKNKGKIRTFDFKDKNNNGIDDRDE